MSQHVGGFQSLIPMRSTLRCPCPECQPIVPSKLPKPEPFNLPIRYSLRIISEPP